MKKVFKIIGILLLVLIVGAFIAVKVFSEKEPEGISGDAAEQLTQKMFAAINKAAWDSTAWVQWDFAERNQYLWDRKNHRVRVTSGDVVTILNTQDQTGTAMQNGQALKGEALQKALKAAWANFCNDSFWLNAPAKATDPGTSREVVDLENGGKGLKVTYASGGVTPGDVYVWELDENGLPIAYKMWVSIIPVKGMGATWEKYISLPTGAKISTSHKIGGKMDLLIKDVDGGMDVPQF